MEGKAKLELDKLQEHGYFKEYWLYNYTHRYVFDYFDFYGLKTIYFGSLNEQITNLRRYYTDSLDSYLTQHEQDYEDLNFANCLVYEHYTKTAQPYFNCSRYDELLYHYNYPYRRVDKHHYDFIECLQSLTTQFGFLFLTFTGQPDRTLNWELFIDNTLYFDHSKFSDLISAYPKDGYGFKGLQINVRKYSDKVDLENWDLAIHFKFGTPILKLKKQLKGIYKSIKKQSIGDEESADISVYVVREQVSPSRVIKYIDAQLKWLKIREDAAKNKTNNRGINSLDDFGLQIMVKSEQDAKKILDLVKTSSGFNERMWPIDKNNIRRAIGLHHWDIIASTLDTNGEKIKLEPLLKATYERLADEKPALLNYYRHGYYCENTKKLNINTAEAYGTIISEMRKDYTMTVACIKSYSYLSPQETKNLRKEFKR